MGLLPVGKQDELVHELFGLPDHAGRALGAIVVERYAQGRMEVSFPILLGRTQ